MTLNKILNILGGGLISATLLLLILWSITSPPAQNNGPVLLIATGIEMYVLIALLSIFTGFLLSIVTSDEGIEKLYLRYGIFLGVLLLLLAAGSAAFEGKNSSMGTYQFPTFTDVFATFFIVDSIALAVMTLLSATGYGLGCLIKTFSNQQKPQLLSDKKTDYSASNTKR